MEIIQKGEKDKYDWIKELLKINEKDFHIIDLNKFKNNSYEIGNYYE